MSTISGSDNSSRQDDKVRRTREEYRQNESDMVKKHQKELRRISELHNEEIERLKKAHETQLNELKRSTQETISSRDHKYQQEMESVRELHRKQLENTASSANRKIENTKKFSGEELKESELRHQQRISELTNDYAKANRAREEVVARSMKEMRDQQQSEVQNYRERLNQRHANELEMLAEVHQRELSETENQARNYKKNAEARFRDQELRSLQNRQKASDDLVDTVRRERANQSQNEKILRQGFEDGIAQTRKRFEDRASDERQKNEAARDATKADVYERVNNQLRMRERENQELRAANARKDLARKAETERTIDNMRDAFQENVKVAEQQRAEAIRVSNKEHAKDIHKIQRENSDRTVEMTRGYLEKVEDQEERAKANLETIESDFKARQEYAKTTADQRVRHVINETEMDKARLAEMHDNSRSMAARSHKEEMDQLRVKMERDKRESIERMKDMMRKMEAQHQEKSASIVAKYEKEIARMNDEMARVKRDQGEQIKRLQSELDRQHRTEMDVQQSQYQDKLRKVQEQHSDEIRMVNQRHQERMDQLLTATKKA